LALLYPRHQPHWYWPNEAAPDGLPGWVKLQARWLGYGSEEQGGAGAGDGWSKCSKYITSPKQSVWMPAPSQPWATHVSELPADCHAWYERGELSRKNGEVENLPRSSHARQPWSCTLGSTGKGEQRPPCAQPQLAL